MTYGTEGQPFFGGWTEVEAETEKEAIDIFRLKHPDKKPSLVNCARIYSEDEFLITGMLDHGNFGQKCHERLSKLTKI